MSTRGFIKLQSFFFYYSFGFKGTVPQNIFPLKSGHTGCIGFGSDTGLQKLPLKKKDN